MAENLSDFGLVAPTSSSNVGQPGGELGGEAQLQQALSDTPTLGDQVSGRGILAGLLGTALAGAVGGAESATRFGQGLLAGLQDSLNQDLREQENQVRLANSIIEQENKQRNLLGTLVGQLGFEAFETSDQNALNAMLFGSSGVEISPAHVMAQRRASAKKAAFTDAMLTGVKEADGPEAQRFFARAYFSSAGLNLPDEVINSWASAGGIFTPQEAFDNFSNWKELLEIEQETGVFPIEQAVERISDTSFSPSEQAKSLLDRVSARQRQELSDNPDQLLSFQDVMMLELDEGERIFLNNEIKGLDQSFDSVTYARLYMQTMGHLGIIALMQKGAIADFDEGYMRIMKDLGMQTQKLQTQDSDRAKQRLVDKVEMDLRQENDQNNKSMTQDEFDTEVDRRVNKLLTSSGN